MLPTKFVETLAREMDVGKSLVGSHARKLREAGMLPVLGRGNSAARMTARDGATLLVAVAGSEAPSDGPGAVEDFARAALVSGNQAGVLGALGLFGKGLNAGEAVHRLLLAASEGSLDKVLRAAGIDPGDAASNAFEATFVVTPPVMLQIRFAGFRGESSREQVNYTGDGYTPPPRTRTMRLVSGKAIVNFGRALSA